MLVMGGGKSKQEKQLWCHDTGNGLRAEQNELCGGENKPTLQIKTTPEFVWNTQTKSPTGNTVYPGEGQLYLVI